MRSDDIARARAIPLGRVLEELGAVRDPKDPAHNWRVGSSRITVTDSRFYDHNGAGAVHRMRGRIPGGGGAIDLVQYLQDIPFQEAVARLTGLRPLPAVASRADVERGAARSGSSQVEPMPNADRSARVRWYLTQVRGVPTDITDKVLAEGQVFGDTRGNVVFRLRDLTGQEVGFELRGTHDRAFHSVHGKKGLFILKGDSTRTAAFVESGIEALSLRSLHGSGLVISTTGSAIELPSQMIKMLSARGFHIVAAFNADQAGDRMSERLSEASGILMHRKTPHLGKDWNDVLRQRHSRSPAIEDAPREVPQAERFR